MESQKKSNPKKGKKIYIKQKTKNRCDKQERSKMIVITVLVITLNVNG